MPYTPENVNAALKHLRAADPVMKDVIRRVGPFVLKAHRDRFGLLVRSIISQQISTKAAASIRRRVEALVAPQPVSAEALLRVPPEDLRGAGVSPQKLGYLLDLSEKVSSGAVQLRTIGRLPDEAVIRQLVQVKGIGRWTAQMFLMFGLGRLDVLPHDDLGIRAAMRKLYALRELPNKETMNRIAEPWRPYATIACWYCWRTLDPTFGTEARQYPA